MFAPKEEASYLTLLKMSTYMHFFTVKVCLGFGLKFLLLPSLSVRASSELWIHVVLFISNFVRAFLSLQKRRPFPGPPIIRLLPLWCLHISALGTDRSQRKPYQENMGDEEGFQIHSQSQQLL